MSDHEMDDALFTEEFADPYKRMQREQQHYDQVLKQAQAAFDLGKVQCAEVLNGPMQEDECKYLSTVHTGTFLPVNVLVNRFETVHPSTVQQPKKEFDYSSGPAVAVAAFFDSLFYFKENYIPSVLTELGWTANPVPYDPVRVSACTREMEFACTEWTKMVIKQTLRYMVACQGGDMPVLKEVDYDRTPPIKVAKHKPRKRRAKADVDDDDD